jgi:propanol-preferring alcohol dehydrogenase
MTMLALQLTAWQSPAELREVEVPTPGPGEILIKVAGSGACHSDLHVMEWPAGALPYRLPFTLGHETAGWVEQAGPGVTAYTKGQAVMVYGPWGCGRCHACARGAENYCENAAELGAAGGGLGRDGGMAEYMLVPSERLLVPLGELDPRTAAPLADAALTPYHAIRRSRHLLLPHTAAVVIGVGGLGLMAVQLLTAIARSTVIAVDVDRAKLDLAHASGAEHGLTAGEDTAAEIRKLTGGSGAAFVLDCVGSDATMALAAAVAGVESDVAVVGLAGGTLPFRYGATAWETSVRIPYWGTRPELIEVIEMARSGALRPQVELFPLREAADVYRRLHDGQIAGRAVVLPHD